jgi:hypothetical protein
MLPYTRAMAAGDRTLSHLKKLVKEKAMAVTRAKLECIYAVHPGTIIIKTPGKFEGEPLWAPYYWDLALEGNADMDDCVEGGYGFKLDASDVEVWPELKGTPMILLFESDNGFVYTEEA